MKRLRPSSRLCQSVLAPTASSHSSSPTPCDASSLSSRRLNSTLTSSPLGPTSEAPGPVTTASNLPRLPTIPPARNPTSSAKLAALHSRLSLHPKYPIQTLGRALIDSSADADARFHNSSLAMLGNTLAHYYITEYLMVMYPRLPHDVLAAAIDAYVGNKAFSTLGHEWGIECVFEPNSEVDAGLLQFKRLIPGTDPHTASRKEGVSQEHAMGKAVRAIFAGVFVHEGLAAAKQFFKMHVLSRSLDVGKMFDFKQPTRELSRLCAREGFEPPIARLLAETGRHSRNPVFVVGVYSGPEMMGEGHGGSLPEARTRAAVNALKGWYLYSPPEKKLPSDGRGTLHKPAYIDPGEVVV